MENTADTIAALYMASIASGTALTKLSWKRFPKPGNLLAARVSANTAHQVKTEGGRGAVVKIRYNSHLGAPIDAPLGGPGSFQARGSSIPVIDRCLQSVF